MSARSIVIWGAECVDMYFDWKRLKEVFVEEVLNGTTCERSENHLQEQRET